MMNTPTRYSHLDRLIARSLIAAIVLLTPLSVSAGVEFDDANHTTYDEANVTLNNDIAGETLFTIDTNQTSIFWEDFQQPEDNTLDFNFTNADANSTVFNFIGAQNASTVNGTLLSNGRVVLWNQFGVHVGGTAIIDVGEFVAVTAPIPSNYEAFTTESAMNIPLTGSVRIDFGALIRAEGNISLLGRSIINHGDLISERGYVFAIGANSIVAPDWDILARDFLAPRLFTSQLSDGRVENHGTIHAKNAALFGGHIVNTGDIEIEDGTLLMVAGDAVWVTEFDNPVLIKVPNYNPNQNSSSEIGDNNDVQYAIENHGRIDTGLGNIRLAAADPLGFAIRQGTGSPDNPASITAQKIALEGGENGRIHLSGEINASNLVDDGRAGGGGGEIDITGAIIVLEDATINASGRTGGGTIQIGGEQEGRGELQRARAVLVDEDSEIHADAIDEGDGGRVILFAEEITSVDGEVTARGGENGGDGGFVETSGLRHFSISRAPDVSAPKGQAGAWLIDPFNITIDSGPNTCDEGTACLDNAILAILSPNFDSTGFDGILRTVSDTDNPQANFVSADLIATALQAGTSVTLSTQAFGLDRGTDDGNITISSAINIDGNDAIAGTLARLTLLAAGDITIMSNSNIMVSGTPNVALTVELHANDSGQVESDQSFETNVLEGDIILNANIQTAGGDVILSGSSVLQQSGTTIDTDGGAVDIRSGSLGSNGAAVTFLRDDSDPNVSSGSLPDPRIEIAGGIDTSNGTDEGGNITLIASSINVETNELEEIVTGQLTISGSIQSGGGNIILAGGQASSTGTSNFAGNVEISTTVNSAGGDILIISNHVDPDDVSIANDISFLNALGEGGEIIVDGDLSTDGGTLTIGGERTQSISIDGTVDTRSADTSQNGLLQIVALDLSSVDTTNSLFGQGQITIGGTSATALSTSAFTIEAREVTFSAVSGVAVSLLAVGSSTAVLPAISFTDDTTDTTTETADLNALASGEIRITGGRQLTFNQNTLVTGDSIQIVAAANPGELADSEMSTGETRLFFEGSGGDVASTGVRLNADTISISVGDGTTTSGTLFAEVGTADDLEVFGLKRLTRGRYDGLQLRHTADDMTRPEVLTIAQDGDFTVTNTAPILDGELDLAAAFGSATNSANDTLITLESSDGRLQIMDAAAFNNDGGGNSYVVLNGGLFLPMEPNIPDVTNDSVVFGDGSSALGVLAGTTAFDVESLTVSSAGDFTVRDQVMQSIDASNLPAELVFEAGRDTGVTSAVGRGTLTVEANLSLEAGTRLALLAGATGFGDLVFEGPGTTLTSDTIELRAGAGSTSQNTDTNARSQITGLQSLSFEDGGGNAFGAIMASTATSFSIRQDAAVNASTDLPDITQFGLSAAGFRTEGDVRYSVRSDQSNITLDNAAINRFTNAHLSLIGVDSGLTPAIDVSSGFTFVGTRVEVGGIGDFSYTQNLATAFNRSGTDAEEEITLRAGVGGIGTLNFENSVIVKAPRIHLMAGTGVQLNEDGFLISESRINTDGAQFDLEVIGMPAAEHVFSHYTTSFFDVNDLPDADQFVNGILPNILGIRNDIGVLDLQDFDVSELPLDLTGTNGPGRLILEAATITLAQTDGDDLELTSASANPNLTLRLRTNELTLIAADGVLENGELNPAAVLIGSRMGDNPVDGTARADSAFDNESLLIEAFDVDATGITTNNLSSLSETSVGSGLFELDQARGPSRITLTQDKSITPDDLFHRDAVAGQLAQGILDEASGVAQATIYTLTSNAGSVTIDPDNVDGSSLFVTGIGTDTSPTGPLTNGIFFGSSGLPETFTFANLVASTESSIILVDGTQLIATDVLSLAAGQVSAIDADDDSVFGELAFGTGSGVATTTLRGNKVLLTAGPNFKLEIPGSGDIDGELDPVLNENLSRIDFTRLSQIILNTDTDADLSAEDSVISITQSADLSMADPAGDFLRPIEAGSPSPSTPEWATLNVTSTQGNLVMDRLDVIAEHAASLVVQTLDLGSRIEVTVPNQSDTSTPFDDFQTAVEFQSNDILFQTTDATTFINLASEKLSLISTIVEIGTTTAPDPGQLRNTADVDNRAIVRIKQVLDFTNTELPLPTQYFEINSIGERNVRPDLSGLDIELTTSGTILTLDNNIRSRVTTSNLILNSGGDVSVSLSESTPGFTGLDRPDLQLSSLEINTNVNTNVGGGTITIEPFTIDMAPETLRLETTGDQRFNGFLALDNTLSTRGRDITFADDINVLTPTVGLAVSTSGKSLFEGNIGSSSNPLDHLTIAFDNSTDTTTPSVEFRSADPNTPQTVDTTNDILFVSYDFSDGDRTTEIENALSSATSRQSLETALSDLGLGRTRSASFATIGRANGDLSFSTTAGHFVMGSGERLSVGGTADIDVDNGLAALGDVAALILNVTADEILLVRRDSGGAFSTSGEYKQDGGASILANTINFTDDTTADATPTEVGAGRSFLFGLPNPFDAASVPNGLNGFPIFEINANGAPLKVSDFQFLATTGELANQIPSLKPLGASRSDLSGAFGPETEPTPYPEIPELPEPSDPTLVREIGVDARKTPTSVLLARLEGAAIIDDLEGTEYADYVNVTTARIDAQDAEKAVKLYQELFGEDGGKSGEVQGVLQDALDRYLENSRARRVVGFELRRFVKNRPSTLFEAYQTLDKLDALFRFHRRLGLSPGEYRGIQKNWLREIQPDGISLDELAEAIHPSRYVRGSDILDIFGR